MALLSSRPERSRASGRRDGSCERTHPLSRLVDPRSFEVAGKDGDHAFRIWFLPTDWIGIRQPDPKRTRMVYWEGILMDQKYKSITLADQVSVYEAVHAIGMNTPSLVNSGWQIADPSSGPALRQGLQATPANDRETAMAIADAIGRIRYRPAGQDILARLLTEQDRFLQGRYVQTLAALQFAPAVSAIEKLCETTNVSAEWILSMTLSVNAVDVRAVDLSGLLSTPGTHSVQYRLLDATSNQLALQVR